MRIASFSWLVLALALSACGDSSAPRATAGSKAESALTLVSDTELRPRLHEIVVHSPAMEGEQSLRVLLPSGYDADAVQLYPVLYLLHGCCDFGPVGYEAWSENTDVEAFTAGMPVVIVMPHSSSGGLYSDWYNNGAGGTPRWETYHIRELLPWIEQNYRVRQDRGGRMLAGLSMGGHGAFTYGARYPDLFGSAAAYSPFIDTNTVRGLAFTHVIEATDGGAPGSAWGQRALEEVRWRGHNPWDLAENLAPLQLFIRTGNGYNDSGLMTDPIENSVNEMSHNMHDALDALGIPNDFDDYGTGTHSWPFWQEDLHQTLPVQLAHAQQTLADPEVLNYRSIDASFTVFGWNVEMQRDVIEFVRLGAASSAGFTLSGSGSGLVTTPSFYQPGKSYHVAIDDQSTDVTADGAGHLTLALDLGPSRTLQEYRPGSPAGYLRTVSVVISD